MSDTIHFKLHVENFKDDIFKVISFNLQESLSSTYQLQIELFSRQENINEDDLIDEEACITLWRNHKIEGYRHGIICSFSRADCGFAHRRYKMIIVPQIYRLTLRHNCRIFQDKTVQDIVSTLLKEMGIFQYSFNISRKLRKREYCIQYRESDFDFISRLMNEEGIGYTFEHKRKMHKVIFFDSNHQLQANPNEFKYKNISSCVSNIPFVSSFVLTSTLKTSSVALKDYSFKKPNNKLSYQVSLQGASGHNKKYEHFDYPGRFKDADSGKKFTKHRLEYLGIGAHEGHGISNILYLCSGEKITLHDHTDTSLNRAWLVISITHIGEQTQAAEEFAGEGLTKYQNTFTVIPHEQMWRTDPIQKPRMYGPQIAKVTGPAGEEIFCDEFGRVKVQFPWDNYPSTPESASCWIRVSHAWAGSDFGMVSLPRVGDEVIVSFLDGDPDQPIITGRTYNAVNHPPYSLPKHKTKTVFRTQTYKGKGFNELSFEDQDGKEAIYFHAEKDLVFTIKNDQNTSIQHDRRSLIGNDSLTTIKNDAHLVIKGNNIVNVTKDDNLTIGGSQSIEIQKDKSLIVNGEFQINAKNDCIVDTDKALHLKGGSKIIIDAGSEITLKAGSSFISINASGIDIVGSKLNLNSGGNASSAKSFNGKSPTQPKDLGVLDETPQIPPKQKPSVSSLSPHDGVRETTISNPSVSASKIEKKDNTNAGELFDTNELLYSHSIQKTADKYRTVIGLRAPNKLGQLHLAEGHPSKNFHIKAKSSNSGPTVGFITEKALYSKIKQTPENIEKHNKNIQDSLKKNGKLVPLILTDRQIKQAVDAKLMEPLNEQLYLAKYHSYDFVFTITEKGEVQDVDGPVMVLTNPPEISSTPRKSKIEQNLDMPVTADYDLFALLPNNNASNNDLGYECAPRFMGNVNRKSDEFKHAVTSLTSPRSKAGAYHPDQGNTHTFGETINADLNRNVKNEGYTGGVLFWHGNEANNPYSPGLDLEGDKPIFFIPNEPPRQIFTQTQLKNFYKEMKNRGFNVQDNPRF